MNVGYVYDVNVPIAEWLSVVACFSSCALVFDAPSFLSRKHFLSCHRGPSQSFQSPNGIDRVFDIGDVKAQLTIPLDGDNGLTRRCCCSLLEDEPGFAIEPGT